MYEDAKAGEVDDVITQPVKETYTDTKGRKHMQTSMQGIASKVKRSAKYRFGNLYSLLNKESLQWSFKQLNKKATPGVDGVDYQKYATELEENIKELAENG